MKQIYSASVYISDINETVKTIAKKHNLEEFDILKLNSRFKNIHVQPLTPIHLPSEDQASMIQESRQETPSNDIFLMSRYIDRINYEIKELILSKIFINENTEFSLNTIRRELDKISYILQNKLVFPTQQIIEAISNLSNFAKTLDKNDSKEITLIQKRLDKVTDEIINSLAVNKNNQERLNLSIKIHEIKKQWQMYILKLAGYKFNEAANIYDEILEKVEALIKTTFSS